MTEKMGVCMAMDLPLASRRTLAVRAVREIRERIRKMTETELEERQHESEKDKDMLKQIHNEEARLKVEELQKRLENDVNKAADALYKAFWETGMYTICSLLGKDAVDFALETTKNESLGN
ncbi:MAG: hypothetical protein WCS97_00820 [Candidatus Paceibacterota bacterium]|jgi:RNA polymerase-binding transcription factor DksA